MMLGVPGSYHIIYSDFKIMTLDRLKYYLTGICLLAGLQLSAQDNSYNYLHYAQAFADRLLETAKDTYGPVQTELWASVINAKTGKIPRPEEEVPATAGTRNHDRAVWGSNFYHDVSTVKLMFALSELTGEDRYREEAEAYVQSFLTYTQNPQTGLLGWGEHLYYHFYEDSVGVGIGIETQRDFSHEFLAATPPLELFWGIDSARTRKAIAGLRYHFRGFQTQSYLFNRHAHWNVVRPDKENWYRYQFQRDGQPWIKHSALLSYSFYFLHAKTDEEKWAEWGNGVGTLYWRHRHPETDLVVGCIDDQRPMTRYAQLTGTTMLAYWLLKTYEVDPSATWAKSQAEVLLKAIEQYCWDQEQQIYSGRYETDGSLAEDEPYNVFATGYSSSGVMEFGRMVAYFAKKLADTTYLQMVKRAANIVDKTEFPEIYVINSLAVAVNFYLDIYELTQDTHYLTQAKRFADKGIDQLYQNGLFVRQPGDEYYEAKLGTGSYVLGLLRLHMLLHPEADVSIEIDGSM